MQLRTIFSSGERVIFKNFNNLVACLLITTRKQALFRRKRQLKQTELN